MASKKRLAWFLLAALPLCSCQGLKNAPATVEAPSVGQSGSFAESSLEAFSAAATEPPALYPEVWEALHAFNWMSDDGISEEQFAGKPFLQENDDGITGAAGVLDVDRDGELEFVMGIWHCPRGVPSVEVFELQGGRLQSVGGFFQSEFYRKEGPITLSYYRDAQDRLLLVQQTQAGYGGCHDTWIATDVSSLQTFPIATLSSDYDQDPICYYVYPSPDNEQIHCTNYFLCTGSFAYEDPHTGTEVTKEEYEKHIREYMDLLDWTEDVPFEYSIYYHLHNWYDIGIEFRYKEMMEADDGSFGKFYKKSQSPESLKETSDLVADAVYADYVQAMNKK